MKEKEKKRKREKRKKRKREGITLQDVSLDPGIHIGTQKDLH